METVIDVLKAMGKATYREVAARLEIEPVEALNMLRLWDDLNDRYAPPEVVRELARIALASLDADKQELKPANLANKFYERYPLATFKSDTARAEALGYFMAGAELQCFGEFVKYEEMCGDE
ncbi:TPA: hypothetical protein JHK52_002120 [Citrobacter koseri]|nr:hypothetical protein [Citrobacter koseri]